MTTTNDELVKRIRAAIASSRDAMRDAANDLQTLQCQGMTQREIAAAVGKSVGWVNGMVSWRIGGCKGDSPFGPTTKRGRIQHAEQKSAKRGNVLKLAATAPKPEGPILEAVILETVATPTPISAATPAPTPISAIPAPAPAPTPAPLTTTMAFREFKFACEQYLPEMTDAERAEAIRFVAEVAGVNPITKVA